MAVAALMEPKGSICNLLGTIQKDNGCRKESAGSLKISISLKLVKQDIAITAQPMKTNTKFRVHHKSYITIAKVSFLEDDNYETDETVKFQPDATDLVIFCNKILA